MESFRICIADADPRARQLFRSLVQARDDSVLVAECETGTEALRACDEHRPDVIVADVGLPRIDGFTLLREVGGPAGPAFILTTLDQMDAARAFTESAIDCMLKPLDAARCRLSLERARHHVARVRATALARRLVSTLDRCDETDELSAQSSYMATLAVPSGSRLVVIPVETIEWIGAEDCYSRIHADAATYLLRRTLGTLERGLDPVTFIRPHRSAVVNVGRVSWVDTTEDGSLVLVLKSGARIPVSQRRRSAIAARLGDGLQTYTCKVPCVGVFPDGAAAASP